MHGFEQSGLQEEIAIMLEDELLTPYIPHIYLMVLRWIKVNL